MRKPILHETLYSLNVGNAARRVEQVLTEVVVVKVGRKYFTTSPKDSVRAWQEEIYHIDTWREKTDYSANSRLYESEQEYRDEQESSMLCNSIGKAFEYRRNSLGVSLDGLRKISEILSDAKTEGA